MASVLSDHIPALAAVLSDHAPALATLALWPPAAVGIAAFLSRGRNLGSSLANGTQGGDEQRAEENRLLPPYKHPSKRLVVVATEAEWTAAHDLIRDHLTKTRLLGFDCEWGSTRGAAADDAAAEAPQNDDEIQSSKEAAPKGSSSSAGGVALLQIATTNGICILVRLLQLQSFPETLRNLLADQNILKMGVAPRDDAGRLLKDHGLEVKGCVDLRSFTLRCREFEKLEKLGLKSLAEAVLQRSLDKSPRLRQSDWEAEALTPEQMEYAANDALVAVDIFREVALKKVRGHRCLCGFCSTSLKLSPEFWRSSGSMCDGMVDAPFKGASPKSRSARGAGKEPSPKTSKAWVQRSKPLYDNCQLTAPDGEVLCTCNTSKAMWYVDRDLGEVTSPEGAPLVVRLSFEPAGRPVEDGVYYIQEKQNNCVVCGRNEDYNLRKNIIPQEYRKHFPSHMKDHASHDVLLMCMTCHRLANDHDKDMRIRLGRLCGAIPIGSVVDKDSAEEFNIRRVQSFGKALTNPRHKIPEERRLEMKQFIADHYGLTVDEVDENIARKARNEEVNTDIFDYKSHGVKVVEWMKETHDGELYEFERLWRQNFLDTMKPQFLPALWAVDHNQKHAKKRDESGDSIFLKGHLGEAGEGKGSHIEESQVQQAPATIVINQSEDETAAVSQKKHLTGKIDYGTKLKTKEIYDASVISKEEEKKKKFTTKIKTKLKKSFYPISDFLASLDPILGFPSFLVSRVLDQTLKLRKETHFHSFHQSVSQFALPPVVCEERISEEKEVKQSVTMNSDTFDSFLGVWSAGVWVILRSLGGSAKEAAKPLAKPVPESGSLDSQVEGVHTAESLLAMWSFGISVIVQRFLHLNLKTRKKCKVDEAQSQKHMEQPTIQRIEPDVLTHSTMTTSSQKLSAVESLLYFWTFGIWLVFRPVVKKLTHQSSPHSYDKKTSESESTSTFNQENLAKKKELLPETVHSSTSLDTVKVQQENILPSFINRVDSLLSLWTFGMWTIVRAITLMSKARIDDVLKKASLASKESNKKKTTFVPSLAVIQNQSTIEKLPQEFFRDTFLSFLTFGTWHFVKTVIVSSSLSMSSRSKKGLSIDDSSNDHKQQLMTSYETATSAVLSSKKENDVTLTTTMMTNIQHQEPILQKTLFNEFELLDSSNPNQLKKMADTSSLDLDIHSKDLEAVNETPEIPKRKKKLGTTMDTEVYTSASAENNLEESTDLDPVNSTTNLISSDINSKEVMNGTKTPDIPSRKKKLATDSDAEKPTDSQPEDSHVLNSLMSLWTFGAWTSVQSAILSFPTSSTTNPEIWDTFLSSWTCGMWTILRAISKSTSCTIQQLAKEAEKDSKRLALENESKRQLLSQEKPSIVKVEKDHVCETLPSEYLKDTFLSIWTFGAWYVVKNVIKSSSHSFSTKLSQRSIKSVSALIPADSKQMETFSDVESTTVTEGTEIQKQSDESPMTLVVEDFHELHGETNLKTKSLNDFESVKFIGDTLLSVNNKDKNSSSGPEFDSREAVKSEEIPPTIFPESKSDACDKSYISSMNSLMSVWTFGAWSSLQSAIVSAPAASSMSLERWDIFFSTWTFGTWTIIRAISQSQSCTIREIEKDASEVFKRLMLQEGNRNTTLETKAAEKDLVFENIPQEYFKDTFFSFWTFGVWHIVKSMFGHAKRFSSITKGSSRSDLVTTKENAEKMVTISDAEAAVKSAITFVEDHYDQHHKPGIEKTSLNDFELVDSTGEVVTKSLQSDNEIENISLSELEEHSKRLDKRDISDDSSKPTTNNSNIFDFLMSVWTFGARNSMKSSIEHPETLSARNINLEIWDSFLSSWSMGTWTILRAFLERQKCTIQEIEKEAWKNSQKLLAESESMRSEVPLHVKQADTSNLQQSSTVDHRDLFLSLWTFGVWNIVKTHVFSIGIKKMFRANDSICPVDKLDSLNFQNANDKESLLEKDEKVVDSSEVVSVLNDLDTCSGESNSSPSSVTSAEMLDLEEKAITNDEGNLIQGQDITEKVCGSDFDQDILGITESLPSKSDDINCLSDRSNLNDLMSLWTFGAWTILRLIFGREKCSIQEITKEGEASYKREGKTEFPIVTSVIHAKYPFENLQQYSLSQFQDLFLSLWSFGIYSHFKLIKHEIQQRRSDRKQLKCSRETVSIGPETDIELKGKTTEQKKPSKLDAGSQSELQTYSHLSLAPSSLIIDTFLSHWSFGIWTLIMLSFKSKVSTISQINAEPQTDDTVTLRKKPTGNANADKSNKSDGNALPSFEAVLFMWTCGLSNILKEFRHIGSLSNALKKKVPTFLDKTKRESSSTKDVEYNTHTIILDTELVPEGTSHSEEYTNAGSKTEPLEATPVSAPMDIKNIPLYDVFMSLWSFGLWNLVKKHGPIESSESIKAEPTNGITQENCELETNSMVALETFFTLWTLGLWVHMKSLLVRQSSNMKEKETDGSQPNTGYLSKMKFFFINIINTTYQRLNQKPSPPIYSLDTDKNKVKIKEKEKGGTGQHVPIKISSQIPPSILEQIQSDNLQAVKIERNDEFSQPEKLSFSSDSDEFVLISGNRSDSPQGSSLSGEYEEINLEYEDLLKIFSNKIDLATIDMIVEESHGFIPTAFDILKTMLSDEEELDLQHIDSRETKSLGSDDNRAKQEDLSVVDDAQEPLEVSKQLDVFHVSETKEVEHLPTQPSVEEVVQTVYSERFDETSTVASRPIILKVVTPPSVKKVTDDILLSEIEALDQKIENLSITQSLQFVDTNIKEEESNFSGNVENSSLDNQQSVASKLRFEFKREENQNLNKEELQTNSGEEDINSKLTSDQGSSTSISDGLSTLSDVSTVKDTSSTPDMSTSLKDTEFPLSIENKKIEEVDVSITVKAPSKGIEVDEYLDEEDEETSAEFAKIMALAKKIDKSKKPEKEDDFLASLAKKISKPTPVDEEVKTPNLSKISFNGKDVFGDRDWDTCEDIDNTADKNINFPTKEIDLSSGTTSATEESYTSPTLDEYDIISYPSSQASTLEIISSGEVLVLTSDVITPKETSPEKEVSSPEVTFPAPQVEIESEDQEQKEEDFGSFESGPVRLKRRVFTSSTQRLSESSSEVDLTLDAVGQGDLQKGLSASVNSIPSNISNNSTTADERASMLPLLTVSLSEETETAAYSASVTSRQITQITQSRVLYKSPSQKSLTRSREEMTEDQSDTKFGFPVAESTPVKPSSSGVSMEHSSEWVSTTSVLASERDSHLEFSDAEDASEDAAEYVTDVHEKEEDVWVTETSEVVTSFVTETVRVVKKDEFGREVVEETTRVVGPDGKEVDPELIQALTKSS